MLQSPILANFKNTSDTTIELILQNVPTFWCQKAATSTFLNLYFYPWIYQEVQCKGKYNVTTQICEEEDYNDYKEDEDEEEEEVEETSSPTSATPTSSPTSTTSPPTLPTDPIPIDLRKLLFQFHTIKPPSPLR
jgi:hypothetical protein